jgi:hypothetical protein
MKVSTAHQIPGIKRFELVWGHKPRKQAYASRTNIESAGLFPVTFCSSTHLGMGTLSRREGPDEALVDRMLHLSTKRQAPPRRASADAYGGLRPKNTAQSNRKHHRNEHNKTTNSVPKLARRAGQAWLFVGSSSSRESCKKLLSYPSVEGGRVE